MKVFVVFCGENEDRKVVGVFSTRAKAEEIGTEDIEEFELDEDPGSRWGPVHYARMRLADGSIVNQWTGDLVGFKVGWRGEALAYETSGEVLARSPVSREHALKLAVEKRQEWLRTGDLRHASGPGGPLA